MKKKNRLGNFVYENELKNGEKQINIKIEFNPIIGGIVLLMIASLVYWVIK